MIIKDTMGITAEIHLYDNGTGLDFVEEFLDAGLLAPMSPRWLVNKIKDITIEEGTEPSMMQSEGSEEGEEQLLESQNAGAKTAQNTK